MFKDKSTIRLKAMDAMMKDKPSVNLAAKEDPMQGGAVEEGMISMPVTMEEKAMVEAMREASKKEEGAEAPAMEAGEDKAAY